VGVEVVDHEEEGAIRSLKPLDGALGHLFRSALRLADLLGPAEASL
jgi:hypothetical protein